MKFELCKRKTKCKKCKEILKEDEIRGVYGEGYYNNPYVYYCLKCCRNEEINIKSLIKVYQELIKKYNIKINKLKKIKLI